MQQRRLLPVWLALLGLLWPALAMAQAPLPLDRYIARVRDAATRLEAGDAAGAAALLREVEAVTLPDGHTQTLNNAPLADLIERNPAAGEEALAALLALLDPAGRPPPEDAAERLAEVLARPEFGNRESTLLERFWRWLAELITDILRRIGAPELGGGGQALGWLAAALALALLGGTLGFFLIRMRGMLLNTVSAGMEIAPGETRTAAEARALAGDAIQSGNLREATRLLYLATLLTLDERHILHYDRARTNREVLAAVRDQPSLHAALTPVVHTFDHVWYGHREPRPEEWHQYQHDIEALAQLVRPEQGR